MFLARFRSKLRARQRASALIAGATCALARRAPFARSGVQVIDCVGLAAFARAPEDRLVLRRPPLDRLDEARQWSGARSLHPALRLARAGSGRGRPF